MTSRQLSGWIDWQQVLQQLYVCRTMQSCKRDHRLAYTCSNSVRQAKLHGAKLGWPAVRLIGRGRDIPLGEQVRSDCGMQAEMAASSPRKKRF
jgi:hypothetical protein